MFWEKQIKSAFSSPPCLWPAQLGNSGIKMILEFSSYKYDLRGHSYPISDKEIIIFMIIAITREGSITIEGAN